MKEIKFNHDSENLREGLLVSDELDDKLKDVFSSTISGIIMSGESVKISDLVKKLVESYQKNKEIDLTIPTAFYLGTKLDIIFGFPINFDQSESTTLDSLVNLSNSQDKMEGLLEHLNDFIGTSGKSKVTEILEEVYHVGDQYINSESDENTKMATYIVIGKLIKDALEVPEMPE